MKAVSQLNLTCSSTSFKALLATQFLGAFNDNLFKTVVSLLVLNQLVGGKGGILYLSLTAALFFLPYIFFSAIAGWLSDKFSKSDMVRWTKELELFVMVLGFLAFIWETPMGLLLCVFLMGMQSALFSPSKLGMLPEMLRIEDLSKANGFLEFTIFTAIIFGTALAGFVTSGSLGNPGLICITVAILGVGASFYVAKLHTTGEAGALPIDPITPNIRNLREIYRDNPLWLCVLGIAFFWSVGALFQINILLFAKSVLVLSDIQTSLLLASLGFGIGLGSIFAGKASEGKVELGLIPIGAAGIVLFTSILGIFGHHALVSYISVFFLGISSGFFIVPLNAYLQEFSPADRRGAYIAASNFFSNCGMLAVSFLFWFLTDVLSLTAQALFLTVGLSAIGVVMYLIHLLPETLTRCINWIALHVIYRIKKVGIENVPREGGALIVCNHVTYVDAMLLLAALPRPVRFIMYRPIYNSFPVVLIAKVMKAIPISSKDGREALQKTLQDCGDLVESGELVGIFAEGGLSRTGEIQEFKTGLETIMKGRSAPIIPTHLGGLWGSIFSHFGGKVFWKLPKFIPYPTTITFGKPLPPDSSAKDVEIAVRELSGEQEQ
ncbi:MAG: MFS transporter [Bdellovibrionales bacterium]|nr:MFS transporter [Bdellovibrionales bacterium]